eukprot:4950453-Amphidinium_carterae.1
MILLVAVEVHKVKSKAGVYPFLRPCRSLASPKSISMAERTHRRMVPITPSVPTCVALPTAIDLLKVAGSCSIARVTTTQMHTHTHTL